VPEKEEDDEGDSLGNDFRDLLTGVLHAERMPTVEIDACVVRATPGQMMEACEFGDTNGIGVLNADESREVLQRLKDAGAEFLDRPRAVVQSAVNAKLEAVREFRYPIKFESSDGEAIPVEFQTKNLGLTLHCTPVVDADGETIHLQFDGEYTLFIGFSDPEAEGSSVSLPQFSTRRIQSTVTIEDGQAVVLSYGNPPALGFSDDEQPPSMAEDQILLICRLKILRKE